MTSVGTFTAQKYILATGGVSHPETGSTGDGFGWLRDLGHTVKDPTPTIVPLATSDEWTHILSGVSLSFMKITFFMEGKKAFSKNSWDRNFRCWDRIAYMAAIFYTYPSNKS